MSSVRFVVLSGPQNASGDTAAESPIPGDSFKITNTLGVLPGFAYTTGGIGDISAAKTFVGPTKAVLVNQSLTYTAVNAGVSGNDITITLEDPLDNDIALDVNVTGTDIVVTLATDSGGVITSTGNAVKAAINADPAALLLVLVSGTNASVVTALTETPLAGGTAGKIDASANTISITTHGFYTTQPVVLTTDGTLPAGLSLLTTYYVIKVDANTIKLASSFTNASQGIAVDITGTGSTAATASTHTATTADISGTFKLKLAELEWPSKRPADNGVWVLGFVSGEDTAVVQNAVLKDVQLQGTGNKSEGGVTYTWYTATV